jgi:hypothetical protein
LNVKYSWQVKDAKHRLRHKLFPPIAWMKLTDFHISTATDRGTLLSAAVPMVLTQPHGGTAMFTRSTPGCGTLDGPSLVWATSLWPKLKSSDGSPCLRLPSTAGQLSWLASDHYMNMHGIYMVYTMDIPCISCLTINHAF